MSSTSANATSPTVSAVLIAERRAPPACRPPPSLSTSFAWTFNACSVGATPNVTPVASAVMIVNARTRASRLATLMSGSAGPRSTSRRMPPRATNSPAAAPIKARTSPRSVPAQRFAAVTPPSASRSATSRCRVAPRAGRTDPRRSRTRSAARERSRPSAEGKTADARHRALLKHRVTPAPRPRCPDRPRPRAHDALDVRVRLCDGVPGLQPARHAEVDTAASGVGNDWDPDVGGLRTGLQIGGIVEARGHHPMTRWLRPSRGTERPMTVESEPKCRCHRP